MNVDRHRGGCLCGAVTFETKADLREVLVCHCSQCRRSSGHLWAATAAPADKVTIHGRDDLRWYRSSDRAQRGFCSRCGSSLFWKRDGSSSLSISAGCLELPTGLRTGSHIYVEDASDYYAIHPDERRRGISEAK